MPQDKPTVDMNLDTLQREGGTPEPFVVTLGGKPYKLRDPGEIPWDDLLDMRSNPSRFLQLAVEPAKSEEFAAATSRLATWKVTALAQAYRAHYPNDVPDELSGGF